MKQESSIFLIQAKTDSGLIFLFVGIPIERDSPSNFVDGNVDNRVQDSGHFGADGRDLGKRQRKRGNVEEDGKDAE